MPSEDWKIDYNSENSFKNWVDPDKLDLTCTDKSLIGAIGTFYFVSFAIGCLIIPVIGDKKGRKYIYFICMTLQNLLYIFVMTTKSIYSMIAIYAFIGLMSGARVGIGPTYISEFLPSKNQILSQTVLSMFDGSVTVVFAILFQIFRNWYPVALIGLIWSFLVIFSVFIFIPESPKYLYASRKFDKARTTMEYMGRINGKVKKGELEGLVFDTERELMQFDNLGVDAFHEGARQELDMSKKEVRKSFEDSSAREKLLESHNLQFSPPREVQGSESARPNSRFKLPSEALSPLPSPHS